LIRVFKELEIDWSFENEFIGYCVLNSIQKILSNPLILGQNPKILKNFTSLRFLKNLFLKTDQSQYY